MIRYDLELKTKLWSVCGSLQSPPFVCFRASYFPPIGGLYFFSRPQTWAAQLLRSVWKLKLVLTLFVLFFLGLFSSRCPVWCCAKKCSRSLSLHFQIYRGIVGSKHDTCGQSVHGNVPSGLLYYHRPWVQLPHLAEAGLHRFPAWPQIVSSWQLLRWCLSILLKMFVGAMVEPEVNWPVSQSPAWCSTVLV